LVSAPGEDDEGDDRPTVVPPFDVESFARAATGSGKAEAPTPVPPGAPASEREAPLPPTVRRGPSPSNIEAALLDAAERPPAIVQRSIDDPVREMRVAFQRGDYAGAIEVADLVLSEDAANADALHWKACCVAALEYTYSAKLRPLERVPVQAGSRDQADAAGLDHRAAYMLALVDGKASMRDIIDVCGMPRVDALRILEALVRHGVITFR
jgi:hypothetical protein